MPKKKSTPGLPAITRLPSGSYRALVYTHTDSSGKKRYESFTNPDYNALVMELMLFKAEQKRNKKKKKEALTLGAAFDRYIESKSAVLSPSTIKSYRAIRRNNLTELYPLNVEEITQEQVQIAINKEAMTRTPKTVANIHGILAAVLQVFRPDFVLHTTLPQKKRAEIQIPTEEEVQHLLRVTRGTEMEVPIILGALCGMRRSEICALTWDDIDFEKSRIHIRKALVLSEDLELVEKGTKTTAGTRSIRLFPPVAVALLDAKAAQESRKEDNESDDSKEGDNGSEYITIKPDLISHRFEKLLKREGIRHYRFHDLRHYTVSVMLSLNVPKNYIANFVGHSSERMIDQVYGHIMANKKTSVEDVLQTYYNSIFQHEILHE